jgi:hypothetical protein
MPVEHHRMPSLPPGQVVRSDSGEPLLWVGDGPAEAGRWAASRREHAGGGWWPLLLGGKERWRAGPAHDAWLGSDALDRSRCSDPADHDPAVVLATWWNWYYGLAPGQYDVETVEKRLAHNAPFDLDWPGLAKAPAQPGDDPDVVADAQAGALLAGRRLTAPRLGLVPVARPADIPAVLGWQGPINHENDQAVLSSVLRSWEERFGVRLVALGPDTMHLSVAAPPRTTAEAELVAAEHAAFCPDSLNSVSSIGEYARQLVGIQCWHFWWD